ncbi:MAG TPA: hypothetical protein DDW52_28510 [Planctomycetaceae bacterium]|nr:hypothetical protein [Planctomycetaceae bacterium]
MAKSSSGHKRSLFQRCGRFERLRESDRFERICYLNSLGKSQDGWIIDVKVSPTCPEVVY